MLDSQAATPHTACGQRARAPRARFTPLPRAPKRQGHTLTFLKPFQAFHTLRQCRHTASHRPGVQFLFLCTSTGCKCMPAIGGDHYPRAIESAARPNDLALPSTRPPQWPAPNHTHQATRPGCFHMCAERLTSAQCYATRAPTRAHSHAYPAAPLSRQCLHSRNRVRHLATLPSPATLQQAATTVQAVASKPASTGA